jgi:hypothetical protein
LSTTLLQTWRFTTNTSDASTSGRVGVNSNAWATVTQINVNETTSTGVDWSNIFDANAKVGDKVIIQDADDATKIGHFVVAGDIIDNGSWRSIPVTFDSGSGNLPSNNSDVRLAFVFYGSGGASSGGGIPKPVVNGQWIKGVGGAAVWSPWTTADLDAAFTAAGQTHRLGPNAVANISDWNTAQTNGWYTALSAANAPGGNAAAGAPGWLLGTVVDHNNSWPTQEVWDFTAGGPQRRWRRQCINTSWQPWQLLDSPWYNINAFSGYAAGCGDYDASHWGPARICKRNGVVIGEGLVAVGAPNGTGVWTLPVDFRPLASRGIIFNTACGEGGHPETWRVDGSGQVTCSLGPVNWITVTGITFYAEG